MLIIPEHLNIAISPIDVGAIVLTASSATYLAFHKYEFNTPIPVVTLLFLVPAALSGLTGSLSNQLIAIPAIFLAHWSLLLCFTVLYRISPFHPLAKFPGPFLHKVSKLKVVFEISKGTMHHYYQELHEIYGDIVRVGPNELSYCNVDGVTLTLGAHGLPKGPFYERGQNPNLVTIRDASEHVQRRKVWNRAFNASSLQEYDSILIRRSRELVGELTKRQSETVDISKWMEYFAWDFMGDMAFSFSFDLMKEGSDTHGYWSIIMNSIGLVAILAHVPWALPFVRTVINPGGKGMALYNLSQKMVGQRLKAGSMTKDLFYHLGNEDEKQAETLSKAQLSSEGVAAIFAGSDTTSTVLANLWYFLLRQPAYYARLREEVDAAFPSGEEPFDQHRLSEMPFLHACINESMRLQPPVPGGSQRSVLPGTGGKMVGPHFIPEGNNLVVHTFSLLRDPRYFFPAPNSFWPDRWLAPEDRKSTNDPTKPFESNVEVIVNNTAFIPFSSGPRICAGKILAMHEMRVIASYMVQRFDMEAAPGYDLDQWEKTLEDFLILKKGHLPIVMTERAY